MILSWRTSAKGKANPWQR